MLSRDCTRPCGDLVCSQKNRRRFAMPVVILCVCVAVTAFYWAEGGASRATAEIGVRARARRMMVVTTSTSPPTKPERYEAEWAQSAARNAACFSCGTREARWPARRTSPRAPSTYPTIPPTNARTPIRIKSPATGRMSDRAVIRCLPPMHAASANGTPMTRPAHHVAMTPHVIARTVGDSEARMRGCPIVKYSTQRRAVTWSCTMPYATAETTQSPMIRRYSIRGSVPARCNKGTVAHTVMREGKSGTSSMRLGVQSAWSGTGAAQGEFQDSGQWTTISARIPALAPSRT